MHVVIDRKKLVFLPFKHESIHVLGDLIWIEAPQAHVHVVPLDHSFPAGLTDLEMMLLYKNTTGLPRAPFVGDYLRNVLFELAERIELTVVNAFELSRQAEQVPEKSKTRYRYAPGQFKPLEVRELFEHPPVKLTRAENESLIASRPRMRPPVPATPAPGTTPAPTAPARPVRAAAAPRQGGVRELVWAVADKMWEAAGKPTDVKIVLNLRKEMMGALETEHNVKRTSSSNELGNWMKARI